MALDGGVPESFGMLVEDLGGWRLDREPADFCVNPPGAEIVPDESAHLAEGGRLLDGAQDSDGRGVAAVSGIPMGVAGAVAGGVFVVGGTWPMWVGWRVEVTML